MISRSPVTVFYFLFFILYYSGGPIALPSPYSRTARSESTNRPRNFSSSAGGENYRAKTPSLFTLPGLPDRV
jgi:hypothetical protein